MKSTNSNGTLSSSLRKGTEARGPRGTGPRKNGEIDIEVRKGRRVSRDRNE